MILGLIQPLAPSIRALGPTGAGLYVGAFWLLGGFPVVPTYAWAALGGWTFGVLDGFSLAMTAFVGAAWLGYAFTDWLGADRARQVIDEQPKWQAVRLALVDRGFWQTLGIVALLRLPPTSPFSFTTYVMAIARVPLGTYLLGTLAGLAPRTLAVVIMFANLQQLDFAYPQQAWLRIAGIIATLVVVVVITRIAQNAIRELTSAERP